MLDQKMITFLEVARLGSFTEASLVLFVTQPAVSQQIRKLEEHYGCSLIEHTGRSFTLTSQGKMVYTYGLLQQANERRLREVIGMENTTMKIGATLSIADYYLPELLSAYLSTHEQPVSLTVGNTKRLTDLMLEGRIMCAFIEGNFDTSLFESRLLCRAPFLPVVSAHHRLARRETSFTELLRYPLLIRERGSGTRAILENHLFTNSRSLKDFPSIQEIGNFKTIKQILSTSEAISFMYEKVAASEVAAGELAYLSCSDFHVDRIMHFIYPRESLMGKRYEQLFYELLPTNTH